MNELNYRAILDTLADAVVACDHQNQIIYVNRAAEDLLGWPPGELVGQPVFAIIPPRLRAAHEEGFQHYVASGVPRLLGRAAWLPALRRDGDEIDIELVLEALPGGPHSAVVALLRDVHERVELERENAVLRYLRAAAAAAARLTSRLDLEQLLQTAVSTLVADFDAALARVWLYDPETSTLWLRAAAGLSLPDETAWQRLDVLTSLDRPAGVARSRRPFVKNGLLGDTTPRQDWLRAEGITAAAIFPLVVGGELWGVLASYARRPLADEVVEALAAFSAIVAAALNDVQLFAREQLARAQAEEARRRAALLAEASRALAASHDYGAALATVARQVASLLADWCAVHLAEPDGSLRLLAAAHAAAVPEGWVAALADRFPLDPRAAYGAPAVLRSGQPEIVLDVPDDNPGTAEPLVLLRELGVASQMIVPLPGRGRTLGTLTLALHRAAPRRYQPGDLLLAEDLARRAALAVDNARLYQEAQEAAQAREQFMSIASHELRTPLTPLHLQIQMLLRQVRQNTWQQQPASRLQAMLEICERQIKQMMKLISDLLDVSRITSGRLELHRENVDLAALTRDIVARFSAEAAHADCAVELLADQPITGHWDRLRLEQVVTNLLSNALKYGAGKPITVAVTEDGAWARLTVQDRGIGIAPEDHGRIFDRFVRAVSGQEFRGLGLGLYIVREIVEAFGGTIQVASRIGEGATFTVSVPRTPPA